MEFKDDYYQEVVEKFPPPEGIAPEAGKAFMNDMVNAVLLRDNSEQFTWAPYMDPIFMKGDMLRPTVHFPGTSEYFGSDYALLVRPLDKEGNAPKAFYGAPLIIGNTFSLQDSGIYTRPLSAIRLSPDIDPEKNELLQIIAEGLEQDLSNRNGQDLITQDLCLGDYLKAFEIEGTDPFSTVPVTHVKAVIPVNQAYTTEAVMLVSYKGESGKDMAYAYFVGDVAYRGRPSIPSRGGNRFLEDINTDGKNAFFNIKALSAVSDYASDVKVGNWTVVALPFVASAPPPAPKQPWDNNDSMTKGSLSFGAVDVAAALTGRATGLQSKLVPGMILPGVPASIIDIEPLAVSSENLHANNLDRVLN